MDFETLKDLVSIITRNKVKQIEVLGNPGQEESRTEMLYDGIAKGKFTSDDDAARQLFQANSKDATYRKTKTKLIRQLVNTAFFIDSQQSMFEERNDAYFNCYRLLAAAQILGSKLAKRASTYLLANALEQSLKFEFTALSCEILRALRVHYGRALGDKSQHQHYTELQRQYEEKYKWESLAFDYHETLVNHYISKRSPDQEIHSLASGYFEELEPLLTKIDSHDFYLYSYQIALIKFFSINNCQSALEICNTALDLLKDRKSASRGSMLTFALNKLACLTQLHIHEPDDETVQTCLSLAEEGGFNWYRVMSLHFYYRLYGDQYDSIVDIYREAVNHPRFKLLSDHIRDEWNLFGGYLHLLAALGKVDSNEVEKVVGPFKYAKFSNDFKVIDKDKLGMNIPLVLLPVLFNLASGDDKEYGRSVEALEKYRIRYLNNDLNRRSAAFMKMLFALSDRPYRPAVADRKIAKELETLTREEAQIVGQTFAVEIIPYEHLWEMLKPRDN